MRDLFDKVAFVTGGASGIGLCLARSFLQEKMQVVIADYSPEHLDQARASFESGSAVRFIQADVGDREQVRHAAEEAIGAFGKIHILCNNAGVLGGGSADDPDFEAWDWALRINLGGVINGVKIIAPLIREHGEGGHIVNTSSIAGLVPLPWPSSGAYMTAKVAVRGFTEALRLSLAPHGIGVSCLCPGLTRTPIHSNAKVHQTTELLAMAMDPMQIGAAVIEGIRNNSPYILTHAEFREELREIYEALDRAFPAAQTVPPERRAFEDRRRSQVAQLHTLPMKG